MTSVLPRWGLLFLLVGPAGTGKTALLRSAVSRVDGLRQLPTATTRTRRPDEQEGREHYFLSVERFEEMIRDGELIEYQEVNGFYYGMPRAQVEAALTNLDDLIADIEYMGAQEARRAFPDNTVLVFIQPPSLETLQHRMRARGTAEEEMRQRFTRVPAEMAFARDCDYIILNDNLDEAAEALYGVLLAERSRRALRRLRLEGKMPRAPYSCWASVVIADGPRILTRVGAAPFPRAEIGAGELPHVAALRVLRETLGVEGTPDGFLTRPPASGAAVPPSSISFRHAGEEEQMSLLYVYRLAVTLPAPAGWAWSLSADAPLPPDARIALIEA